MSWLKPRLEGHSNKYSIGASVNACAKAMAVVGVGEIGIARIADNATSVITSIAVVIIAFVVVSTVYIANSDFSSAFVWLGCSGVVTTECQSNITETNCWISDQMTRNLRGLTMAVCSLDRRWEKGEFRIVRGSS